MKGLRKNNDFVILCQSYSTNNHPVHDVKTPANTNTKRNARIYRLKPALEVLPLRRWRKELHVVPVPSVSEQQRRETNGPRPGCRGWVFAKSPCAFGSCLVFMNFVRA